MLIHQYDATTGAYVSSGLADIDPRNESRWLLPAFATADLLPDRLPRTWPFYRDGAWVLLPDYRGRMLYRTSDGEPTEIVTPGIEPAELDLTDSARPSSRHTWIDGEWAVAPELVAQEKRDAMMAEFDRRMAKARSENAGKADAIAAGLLDDEQVYYFKAWAAYQMALVRAIENAASPDDIQWPDTPAPWTPPPPEPEAALDADSVMSADTQEEETAKSAAKQK
ncbi:tail fiber assembly protein [Paraburkholderia antibiotica]|uniref:Tail fiber assembly protein n=1 Tax=Paraburkholderia antibiotica TaxID=2728839 RepID=A0A7X9ZX50_9BURK|nr:tail fiber assembly protein [Paraburkholderia antibiotica]NML31779.1 tail fiber assembly protein [Paraburkholderia antibiotica]